jgi:hypothetical protein
MNMMGGMMGGMGGGGMGGMGGMGMGGMGGGMGGMGGGMMGGGGFRSVPATGLPFADIEPGKTRDLSTKVVSLSGPTDDAKVLLPVKGEPLQLGDISDLTRDDLVQKALRLLAAEKAPDTVAQLVLWRVAAGLDWVTIGRLAQGWANASELALARQFVARVSGTGEAAAAGEVGRLFVEIDSTAPATDALAGELRKGLKGATMLGLATEPGVPSKPSGPAVACKVRLSGSKEASVQVLVSDTGGRAWKSFGQFTVPMPAEGKARAAALADSLAAGLLDRLVRVSLVRDLRVGRNGQNEAAYRVRIENASPLVLNGLTIVGTGAAKGETQAPPSTVLGIAVSPRKTLTVPASQQAVERLGLKRGVRLLAVDLSGL